MELSPSTRLPLDGRSHRRPAEPRDSRSKSVVSTPGEDEPSERYRASSASVSDTSAVGSSSSTFSGTAATFAQSISRVVRFSPPVEG